MNALGGVITVVLLLGVAVGYAYWRNIRNTKVLTNNLSEPLNGATAAKVNIDTGAGNLMIDGLTGGGQVLASGTLQYMENQDVPSRTLDLKNGQVTLTLKASGAGQPWFRLPWAACNGATDWHIHLNPTVSSDITAHSGGGNVKLDLTGMTVNRLSTDTGGGNVDVALPDKAANLSVTAKTGGGNVAVSVGTVTTGTNVIDAGSGAGNVTVYVPSGIAAKIHGTSGMGKVIVDARFNKINDSTYQSADYDGATNKVEITAKSGAGNVTVTTK